jgi:hypothetical protein
VVLPRLLGDREIAEMVGYLKSRELMLRNGMRVYPDGVPPGEPLANFPLSTVVNCPHALELANHPRLLQLAKIYLGCTPTVSSIGIRWNFPTRDPDQVQRYHRDTDDWRFVKFFLYLTDVADEAAGPHVFVRRSHLESGRIRARAYTQADVLRRYGSSAISSITGPRGTMFLADTSGIHKAAVPFHQPRLGLEVGYSLRPIYCFDYRPECLTRERRPLDPYINRLIVATTESVLADEPPVAALRSPYTRER